MTQGGWVERGRCSRERYHHDDGTSLPASGPHDYLLAQQTSIRVNVCVHHHMYICINYTCTHMCTCRCMTVMYICIGLKLNCNNQSWQNISTGNRETMRCSDLKNINTVRVSFRGGGGKRGHLPPFGS